MPVKAGLLQLPADSVPLATLPGPPTARCAWRQHSVPVCPAPAAPCMRCLFCANMLRLPAVSGGSALCDERFDIFISTHS